MADNQGKTPTLHNAAKSRSGSVGSGFVPPIDPVRLDRQARQTTEHHKKGSRSEGQRDRDRVLYASAFRRLGGVTQVVMALDEGHVFHNRLTHSLKVAQVARRIAEKILWESQGKGKAEAVIRQAGGLDPDTVEAAALAHDLGHPPFGHVGEQELDRLTEAAGDPDGFEGNAQSFRIVTRLSLGGTGDYLGLNLTRATLAAVQKYPWRRPVRRRGDTRIGPPKFGYYADDEKAFTFAFEKVRGKLADKERTLEAQIMDWADDITYAVHDIEDFYRAGWIPLDRLRIGFQPQVRTAPDRWADELKADVATLLAGARDDWYEGDGPQPTEDELLLAAELSLQRFPIAHPYEATTGDRRKLRAWSSIEIGRLVDGTGLALDGSKPTLKVDPPTRHEVSLLKQLTRRYVIGNASLSTHQIGQRQLLRELHGIYVRGLTEGSLGVFPRRIRAEAEEVTSTRDEARFVCDVLASMTELSIIHAHGRLTGHALGPLEDPATS
jgi:dGTPase